MDYRNVFLGFLHTLSLLSLGVDDFLNKDSPRVTTEQGVLIGRTMKSLKGRTFFAYRGIPYAAPPVKHLRFKSPEAPQAWVGERSARKEGNPCPHLHLIGKVFVGDEDCLFLNVYTPKLVGNDLSVIVYLHGGAFVSLSGSAEIYGPDLFMDQDIVLVTINYRLGALGFFSHNAFGISGNYGLKDQVAALHWIQENIANFGGNPNSVTITGDSTGGASVHFLMISPLAKGLFHRAIAQSGSAFNPWAFTINPEELNLNFTSRLGCDKDVRKCLQEASPKSLVDLDIVFINERNIFNTFSPTIEPISVEGAFLTSAPNTYTVTDIPLLAGCTTHEGFVEYTVMGNRTVHQASSDLLTRYLSLFPGLKRGTPEWLDMRKQVKQFYRSLAPQDKTEQFLLLSSDALITIGVDEMVRGMNSPVFYYLFTYEGKLSLVKCLTGHCLREGIAHGDETGYMMSRGFVFESLMATKEDRVTIDRLTKMWTNFAKTGSPTPDASLGVSWTQLNKTTMEGYLEIGSKLTMRNTRMNKKRISFYQNLRKKWMNRH